MARKSHGMVGVILVSGLAFASASRAVIFDDDADDPASEAAGEMRDRAERGETTMPDLAPGLQRNERGVIERRGVVLDSEGQPIGNPPPVTIERDGIDIDKSTQRRDSEGAARDQNAGTRHGGTLGNGDGSSGGSGSMGNSPGSTSGSMGNSSGGSSGGGSMGNAGGSNAGGGGGAGGGS